MLQRIFTVFRDDPTLAQRGQAQREALIDLLVWTMFVDRHVASMEEAQIRKEAAGLPWEGIRSIESFIDASMRRTRDVLGSEDAERAYLDDIHERLADGPARQQALAACEALIAIDGDRAASELAHLERVTERFNRSE